MGIIQRALAKMLGEVEEPAELVAEPTNKDVVIEGELLSGSYLSMTIGKNLINKFTCSKYDLIGFMAQDFENGPLSFLKHGKYEANRVKVSPIEYGSDEYKVEYFDGTWEQGNLVCDEFKGTIKGGTIKGLIDESTSFEKVSPGASISGNLKGSFKTLFSLKDEIAFIKGVYEAKNHGTFPAFRVGELLHSKMNSSMFGIPVSGIKKVDNTSIDLKMSLLSLNSGQYVTMKDTEGRLFCFQVLESYRSSGKSITLKELTHDKNEVTLTWNHFRVSTGVAFSEKDFEARSCLRIGVEMRIPKLFENNIMNDVQEIVISNDIPELPVIKTEDKESGFVPQKIKF
jgi:hypothetical protein